MPAPGATGIAAGTLDDELGARLDDDRGRVVGEPVRTSLDAQIDAALCIGSRRRLHDHYSRGAMVPGNGERPVNALASQDELMLGSCT